MSPIEVSLVTQLLGSAAVVLAAAWALLGTWAVSL